MKLFISFILASVSASSAFAHSTVINQINVINQRIFVREQRHCVDEFQTLLSESSRISLACHVETPLSMIATTHAFPSMNPSFRHIQVWTGTVAREISTKRTYLRELVDDCHGRLISTTRLSEVTTEPERFEIANPNLDDSISESFLVSPMTNAQASRALNDALIRCQAAR